MNNIKANQTNQQAAVQEPSFVVPKSPLKDEHYDRNSSHFQPRLTVEGIRISIRQTILALTIASDAVEANELAKAYFILDDIDLETITYSVKRLAEDRVNEKGDHAQEVKAHHE